jgi:hypothetical protein
MEVKIVCHCIESHDSVIMLPWACSHMARNGNWWNSCTKTCERSNHARRPIAYEFLLPFFNSSITEKTVKYYPLLLRFHSILTCQSQIQSFFPLVPSLLTYQCCPRPAPSGGNFHRRD